LGGWQINGIATFQGGQPNSIFSYDTNDLLGLLAQNMLHADVVGNWRSGFHQSIAEWFNTSAFQAPAPGLFGNTGRDIVRNPDLVNWDMSLFKNIPLYGERVHLQLRGEAFNAFNHTQFGAPDNYMFDQTFGVVGSANPGRVVQVAAKVIF
jgi:hypothetical protein